MLGRAGRGRVPRPPRESPPSFVYFPQPRREKRGECGGRTTKRGARARKRTREEEEEKKGGRRTLDAAAAVLGAPPLTPPPNDSPPPPPPPPALGSSMLDGCLIPGVASKTAFMRWRVSTKRSWYSGVDKKGGERRAFRVEAGEGFEEFRGVGGRIDTSQGASRDCQAAGKKGKKKKGQRAGGETPPQAALSDAGGGKKRAVKGGREAGEASERK